jgi:hypothetical protein
MCSESSHAADDQGIRMIGNERMLTPVKGRFTEGFKGAEFFNK